MVRVNDRAFLYYKDKRGLTADGLYLETVITGGDRQWLWQYDDVITDKKHRKIVTIGFLNDLIKACPEA